MKQNILTLVWVCCFMVAKAQVVDPLPDDTVQVSTTDEAELTTSDTAWLQPMERTISIDSLKALRSQPAFEYMQYADSFFRSLNKPIAPPIEPKERAPSNSFDYTGLRALYWLLALAAVIWLVVKLTLGKASFFSRNTELKSTDCLHITAIEPTSHADALKAALQLPDYRQATRQLFLLTVEKLGQNGQLVLAPNKTNVDYLNGLQTPKCRESFAQLSLAYEYVWFGEFVPAPHQFDAIHQQFKTFWQQWT